MMWCRRGAGKGRRKMGKGTNSRGRRGWMGAPFEYWVSLPPSAPAAAVTTASLRNFGYKLRLWADDGLEICPREGSDERTNEDESGETGSRGAGCPTVPDRNVTCAEIQYLSCPQSIEAAIVPEERNGRQVGNLRR